LRKEENEIFHQKEGDSIILYISGKRSKEIKRKDTIKT